MSRPVPERLRELETDVRDLRVLPAAEVRARGRSRGRRQLAVMAAAGAVVVGTVGVAFAWPQQETGTPGGGAAAGGDTRVTCDLSLPSSPGEVHVRVLDGGAAAGLRDATARQLRTREFTVVDGAGGQPPAGATALRYGPAAIGAAALLRAAVPGEAAMQFDPERRDQTIDLTLGADFTRLATTIELNQNLVTVGVPSAPPQCR